MTFKSILIVDDHTLFRTGLSLILDKGGYSETKQAGTVNEALEYDSSAISLILLDIDLPGINGLDGIAILKNKFKSTPIVILSASENEFFIDKSKVRGADGFLQKSAKAIEITNAIMCVLSGGKCFPGSASSTTNSGPKKGTGNEHTLTARQLEVLSLLCEGKSNKVISRQLKIAENTVRVHVSAILGYLDASSRSEAIYIAQKRGVVGTPA